jgi:transposase InsO family protein
MQKPVGRRWAEFRHGVVGHLLAAPPDERGELRRELANLAARTWRHPVSGEAVSFGASTIERWFYRARGEGRDVIGALGRKRRSDADLTLICGRIRTLLDSQYSAHPGWTAKLHADNLVVSCRQEGLNRCPSYQTVRRYLRATGKVRVKRPRSQRQGQIQADAMREAREVRSFEVTHVGGLLHLDFHVGSRQVVTADGALIKPAVLAVIDDHSRLICHIQWYLSETTKDLVHGFSQAIMRRGLPRRLMTDNGAAMTSAEFTEGLKRLGIGHETTLAYSPHQNGKMECFWGQLEGRLMAMLEGEKQITLDLLNRATLSWVEMEYHRAKHSEIETTPVARFTSSPTVMRAKPDAMALRHAFRTEAERRPRRSDGTLTVEGIRYEIPDRYRHLRLVHVRYARWDLSCVDLVCPQTDRVLAALTPIDKTKNADGQRRRRDAVALPGQADNHSTGVAPLLSELMREYAASGLPPAYLPQT